MNSCKAEEGALFLKPEVVVVCEGVRAGDVPRSHAKMSEQSVAEELGVGSNQSDLRLSGLNC